jgi:hypothetical protein
VTGQWGKQTDTRLGAYDSACKTPCSPVCVVPGPPVLWALQMQDQTAMHQKYLKKIASVLDRYRLVSWHYFLNKIVQQLFA